MKAVAAIACLAAPLSCAHSRTPEERALDADLAEACPKAQLDKLVAEASPAQALLLCGRSAAAGRRACDARTVTDLESRLQPHLTLGHSDEQIAIDPLIALALEIAGKELNISWNGSDPDVVVGKLNVSIEHVTTRTVATVPDSMGNQQHVPATQHRFVAKAACQVELGDKTRVVRAQDEARDVTWQGSPRYQIAPKPDPQVPPEQELKKRAALQWLRTLQKALAMNPPETVDVDDDKGCVAYGLALNLTAGDDTAAARSDGDPDRIAACEKLLGEPPGAGIPVP